MRRKAIPQLEMRNAKPLERESSKELSMFCLTKADKTGKTYKKWALVSPPGHGPGKRSGEHWY
jgi:hypothetical protein